MNKKVKGAMLITVGLVGGSIIGSTYVIVRGLNDDHIRGAIVQKISRKIADVAYPKQSNKVSYRSYYEEKCKSGYTRYKTYDNAPILYDSLKTADDVLCQMKDIIQKYGYCTVADMYDLSGCNASFYTMDQCGWSDLKGTSIIRTERGYIIDLPKPFNLS